MCFTKGVRAVNGFPGSKKWDKAFSDKGDRIRPRKVQPGKGMGNHLPGFSRVLGEKQLRCGGN